MKKGKSFSSSLARGSRRCWLFAFNCSNLLGSLEAKGVGAIVTGWLRLQINVLTTTINNPARWIHKVEEETKRSCPHSCWKSEPRNSRPISLDSPYLSYSSWLRRNYSCIVWILASCTAQALQDASRFWLKNSNCKESHRAMSERGHQAAWPSALGNQRRQPLVLPAVVECQLRASK